MFKITHGVVGVPANDFITKADSRKRNSETTYKHFNTHCEQFKHSFFPHTVPEYNKVSINARTANTVETFKSHLKSD